MEKLIKLKWKKSVKIIMKQDFSSQGPGIGGAHL